MFDYVLWKKELTRAHELYNALNVLVRDISDDELHIIARRPVARVVNIFHKALDEFPDAAQRLEEEGRATVEVVLERLKEEATAAATEKAKSQLPLAIQVYRRQTIVVLATLFEGFTRAFLRELFTVHPSRMHSYLGSEGNKGKINLNDIVESSSRRTLLEGLALQSAARVVGTRSADLLARIGTLSNKSLSDHTAQSMLAILDCRHRIVHEGWSVEAEDSDLIQCFWTIDDTLRELRDLAVANECEVTCCDSDEPLLKIWPPEQLDEFRGKRSANLRTLLSK